MPFAAMKLSPTKGIILRIPGFLFSAVHPVGNMKPLYPNS